MLKYLFLGRINSFIMYFSMLKTQKIIKKINVFLLCYKFLNQKNKMPVRKSSTNIVHFFQSNSRVVFQYEILSLFYYTIRYMKKRDKLWWNNIECDLSIQSFNLISFLLWSIITLIKVLKYISYKRKRNAFHQNDRFLVDL